MNSFSFDLIHHDSKLSPFYDQSKTESERSKEALIRSLNRLNRFNSSMLGDAKYVESDLTIGDYLMSIYIGTPKERNVTPKKKLVIPSMSSGLTWIRCGPCSSNCNNQHPSLYDPTSSETYHDILFDSIVCKGLVVTKRGKSNVCQYEYHSGDKFSSGVLGAETFNLKSPGPLSLVSQVGNKVGESANKLSYCLVEKPLELHSKIKFGSDLTLYKQNTEYTIQFKPSPPHTSYHLNLEAISVNDEKIEIPNKKHDMIVDIQTSLTSLPSNIYNEFIAKVKKHFGDATSIEEPEHGTCFLKREVDGLDRPKVVFHFSGLSESHGDFPVNPSTMFEENVDYMCLTIVRKDEISILGNRAQVDVQMIFDLSAHSLTFAALNCIKVSY
ncbi:probable aspartic protease At2g35615 [Tripterygium wilfordii]|uniref:probable aspartic protease At2g35615 n=1 Tax=Tripterygium wilfordii TaxID=458696 RepID=UPI0018F85BB5|nr:probable aspartic protease At2g35615 [Tripterygium wilfordii]